MKERKLNLGRGRGEFIEREETKFRTREGGEGGENLLKERKLNLGLGRGVREGGIY